jgi:hypothetical protein
VNGVTVLTVNPGSHSLHLALVDGDLVTARLDRSDQPDSVEVGGAAEDFLAGREPPGAASSLLSGIGSRMVMATRSKGSA